MNGLVKIKEVTGRYSVSARTLRYYEDMGLIASARSSDYAYRLYDEAALKRLEQILILRKLNISIKDIQRVFSTDSSTVVLEVLGQKVEDIDGEVALLHELREIVITFIHQIENADFSKDADVKLLYEKAKEIEIRLGAEDYTGSQFDVNHLLDVTEKINEKKMPEVRIVRLPRCKMATSGIPDPSFTKVWDFSGWWSTYDKKRRGVNYAALDFLFAEDGGLVWWMMVEQDATSEDCGGYEIIDFEGGLFAVHTSIDEDMESQSLVYERIKQWIQKTSFDLDESHPTRSYMGHMINPTDEIKQALGYHQYEIFVPVKLRS